MNISFIFLAITDPLQNLPGAVPEKGGFDLFAGNMVVIAFAAVLVILFASAWALYFRKPQRPVSQTPEEAAASFSNANGRRRKMKQRYPSLAETGGLPPVKSKS